MQLSEAEEWWGEERLDRQAKTGRHRLATVKSCGIYYYAISQKIMSIKIIMKQQFNFPEKEGRA